MLIARSGNRCARHHYNVENIGLAINDVLRQPSKHADVGVVVTKMVLRVFEARSYLRSKRKPRLDFKSGRWGDPIENRIGKAWILAPPLT